MLSLGIIWNSAQFLSQDIITDINKNINVLETFEFDLGDRYEDFVRVVYASEQMEKWKIDKKINHMLHTSSRKITILFFEFDETVIEYHPFKKKNVYKELESCKMKIREKYKDFVESYTFDIVFHATDNLEELKNCYNSIVDFLNNTSLNNTDDAVKLIRVKNYDNKKMHGGKNE